jgi:glucosyl-3-phosphoglycerate synthase
MMKKTYSAPPFKKVIVLVMSGQTPLSALAAAKAITGKGHILLAGMIPVQSGESLSSAHPSARLMREELRLLAEGEGMRSRMAVCYAHCIWPEVVALIEDEHPDLLLMEWSEQAGELQKLCTEAFFRPPCDIALLRGPFPDGPVRLFVPVRGGPYAELSLRLALAIADVREGEITSLHVRTQPAKPAQDGPFLGISKVLANLPDVRKEEVLTADPVKAILDHSSSKDLLLMGASVQGVDTPIGIGPVVERILCESEISVLIVKTKRSMPADPSSQAAGQGAISVLVDKWFAENTYHTDEFSDLEHLLALKRRQGLTISLAMPALNEEKTVGDVISTIRNRLVQLTPLLDEIVLIDSNSTDRTRAIAEGLGVPVYIHQETLPAYGARRGKGEALWKSLYMTSGDIILWIDTDIVNIHPRFVYSLIGPLLVDPKIQFVKGFYRRPLKVGDKLQAGGGGRVTELTARPLLNLFYPELSGVVQPLSGEYGGRRSALERLAFFSGYGVEIGLLIDIFELFGLNAIAQVDLQERIHHNQTLESLSKMSFAIIQAVIRKLERRYGREILEDVNKTMKLIRYEPGRLFLEVEEIAELERPPMLEITEYVQKFGQVGGLPDIGGLKPGWEGAAEGAAP